MTSQAVLDHLVTIHKIIDILLTIESLIFFTKYQQFHYVNDIDIKGKFFSSTLISV